MTTRRAWALLSLAACALMLTPWAGLSAALVAVAACATLAGLAALAARDTSKAEKIAALDERLTKLTTGLAADSTRVAAMWREYTAHGGS